jgi:hypothetical protein
LPFGEDLNLRVAERIRSIDARCVGQQLFQKGHLGTKVLLKMGSGSAQKSTPLHATSIGLFSSVVYLNESATSCVIYRPVLNFLM